MTDIFNAFSILLSGFSLGVMCFISYEAKKYREWYLKMHEELKEVTRVAADANMQFAERMMRLEEKVSMVSMSLPTTNQKKNTIF